MTSFHGSYWATRVRRRGRHAEHQSEPLLVYDLLLQAWSEGRPVGLDWHGQDAAGLVRDQPSTRHDYLTPAGVEEDTEPSTVIREARKWLGSPSFSPSPQALAG